MSVRGRVKAGIERGLLLGGVDGLGRRGRAGDVLVLAYHNVVPDGERPAGELSLHLPQRHFARQLELLARTHEIVSLPDILRAPPSGGRPRAVITFDDAYRGAVTSGVAEVVARGIPATIFVAPGFLPGRPFWWDVLASERGGVLPRTMRQAALDRCGGRHGAVCAAMGGETAIELPSHAAAADLDSLRAASEGPGITFGSHTWGHPNLARVPRDALRAELARPLAWLRERFPNVIPWLSYPYGITSPAVEIEAEAAGYAGAVRVEGGWVGGRVRSPYRVPRLNVPAGLSEEGFVLRVSGILAR